MQSLATNLDKTKSKSITTEKLRELTHPSDNWTEFVWQSLRVFVVKFPADPSGDQVLPDES